jgi:N-acetylneuraminate synthase
VLVATGASTAGDVQRAVAAVLRHNPSLVLMQCNTNYTGSLENFHHVNLAVLRSFAEQWPGLPLGLSDHTPGHATTLGAVALGACVVEKHFTDDTGRDGPDHPFSMDQRTWREMVDRTRELEASLGDGVKRVEVNEADPKVVQRRCLRFTRDVAQGEVLAVDDLEALRPAPAGSVEPWELDDIVGRTLVAERGAGEALMRKDVEC